MKPGSALLIAGAILGIGLVAFGWSLIDQAAEQFSAMVNI